MARKSLHTLTRERIGILLMAYGSPDSLDDIEAYLTGIREGEKPRLEEVEHLRERYRGIGGRSPLLEITRQQAGALEKHLKSQGLGAHVYVGMKHWHPFIEDAVKTMVSDGVRRAVAIALAPHYSKMSIGGYKDALLNAINKFGGELSISFVESWSDNPPFLQAWVEKIQSTLQQFELRPEDVFVLFTAHSLPQSSLQSNDPYPSQLQESCRRVAEMANLGLWAFAYQSAGLRKGKWLGPDVLERLAELAKGGYRSVLIVPIGFVADHLEILYDIDIECQEFARANNINLVRTEMLNTSPSFIAALVTIVKEQLEKDSLGPTDQEISFSEAAGFYSDRPSK